MSPATKNIVIPVGATFSARFVMQNAGDDSAFNLAGYEVRAQVREHKHSERLIAPMVGTINNASTGDFTISISTTLTSALKPGFYYWDCQLVSGTQTLLPLAGKAEVTRTITR